MSRLVPGDRRIWLAAAVVLGVGALVVLVELLIPRDYYTGTNSVRTRSYEIDIKQGDQLCVPGLSVPGGTGRVQIEVDSRGAPHPAMSATVRAGRQSRESSVPPRAVPGPRKVAFDAPERPDAADPVPGEVCVRAEGQVYVGGMDGIQSDGQPMPVVNGEQRAERVSVWWLPPAGERRSLLSHPGEILQRAALFRPGFVSPAFYWLLLLVWMPALGYGAVRMLATAPERTARRLAVCVGLIAFGNAAAWAFLTPSFNAPDESEHYAYVEWFAQTGKAVARSPNSERAVYSTDEAFALEGVRLFSSTEAEDGRPPWLAADEQRWQARHDREPRPPPRDTGGGWTSATTSHSPAWYATVAPAYLAASGGSTWDRLTAARLIAALYGAIAAACAFFLVREIVPRHPVLAVAAGALVAFQPMFAFISGSVNNDNGVNAAAAVVILLVVRAFRRGLTWRTGVALGAAIAVMPILKGTGYALYPLLILALGVLVWRRHTRADLRAAAALAGAFAIATLGWAVLSQAFDQSALTTPGGEAPGSSAFSDPLGYLSYLWQVYLPPLPSMTDVQHLTWPFWEIYIVRGWGAFGWYAVTFPLRVYAAVFALSIVVGLLGTRVLAANRERLRRDWPVIGFLVLTPVAVMLAVHAAYWTPEPRIHTPEFGRYLFPAITALAAMAVGACLAFGRRWAPVAATALACAVIVVNYAAQLLTLAGFYT